VPPRERLATVPALVSQIVMKLLAKNAEERYQTAAASNTICGAAWPNAKPRAASTTSRWATGHAGPAAGPREACTGERASSRPCLAAFDRIVKSGPPELVLVSGYSGIGKSAVVNELHKALVPTRGLFASGKFDQYKRDIPYATLAQAFQSLVRTLLNKSEAELSRWRDALMEALGPNGRLMVDLVPELKLIIGEPPSVPELPPHRRRGGSACVPAVHRRLRPPGTSAGAVPRRFAMAGRGNTRLARGSVDPIGSDAFDADRRLPGQ